MVVNLSSRVYGGDFSFSHYASDITSEVAVRNSPLYAPDLDHLSGKISKALAIIDRYQIPETDQNHQMLESQKKQLHGKLEFLTRKGSLVRNCLHILEKISQKRNINYLRLIENFRSENYVMQ